MKLLPLIALAAGFMAGCGEAPPPAPAGAPQAASPPGTNAPSQPTMGSAVVDVITQRDKIQAGKRAKATLEATAAKEDQNLKEALNE